VRCITICGTEFIVAFSGESGSSKELTPCGLLRQLDLGGSTGWIFSKGSMNYVIGSSRTPISTAVRLVVSAKSEDGYTATRGAWRAWEPRFPRSLGFFAFLAIFIAQRRSFSPEERKRPVESGSDESVVDDYWMRIIDIKISRPV
jgi:hypothetical protein